MAPPSSKPRLAQLVPEDVAAAAEAKVLGHLYSQWMSLVDMHVNLPSVPERSTEIYRVVRELTQYAQGIHRLDAPAQEYLVSLVPLWSSVLGEADVDDGVGDADPSTPLGLVICATLGRDAVVAGQGVSAVQLAALSGLSDRQVRQLASAGELVLENGSIAAKEARRWLVARGVPGFDPPKRKGTR